MDVNDNHVRIRITNKMDRNSGISSSNNSDGRISENYDDESSEYNKQVTCSMGSDAFGRTSTRDSFSGLKRNARSKSMSNICTADYTPGEIRRIKERLLRTNSHMEPAALKKFTKRQRRTLISLALVDFMAFCSMSIMAPFFPKEAQEKGLSESMAGFVFSFYALIMFLTTPIFGKIMPKAGAKFLFLSGMLTAGFCNILFGMLEYVSDYSQFTTMCLVIRGFEALGASAFSTASYVFVVKSFPDNIGSVLGILETFIGLGMSIGPAIGGLLYSLGGFDLPFFAIGLTMILIVPVNIWLLPQINEYSVDDKNTSVMKLLKIPSVIMTSAIVIVVSSTWSFLDPTLEPHLRKFDLSSEKVGLVFLLFSGLYGLSSLFWGSLADRVNNHWSLMISGMFACTFSLLLLGPSPLLSFLTGSVWLSVVALSFLGISVSLSLLPTFQSVLTSAIEGGCSDSLSTYSVVAGIWSCMYSLGEVIGPSMGGVLEERYDFPITSTIMASVTFTLGITGLFFFLTTRRKGYTKLSTSCDEDTFTESWKNNSVTTESTREETEKSPLIYSMVQPDFRMYTDDDKLSLSQSGKLKKMVASDFVVDISCVKGTLGYTAQGACEV